MLLTHPDTSSSVLFLPLTLSSFSSDTKRTDLIFKFERAYQLLDELLLGGELQETSVDAVVGSVFQSDATLVDEVLGRDFF
jgi:hypothetical protein